LPFEEIAAVRAAEEKAARLKADAETAGREAQAAAETAGREAVAAGTRRAEDEARELLRAAEERAAAFTEKLASDTAEEKKALRAEAAGRMDAAAEIIVKKVVEG